MSMSEQICNRRKDKKINQVDMAQLIGVKQSTISDYETGRATPTIDKLIKIASILGCTVDDLVQDEARACKTEPIQA